MLDINNGILDIVGASYGTAPNQFTIFICGMQMNLIFKNVQPDMAV
jgi:hypothetical protein